MDTMYLLWHSHPTGASEKNEKLIGVYLTAGMRQRPRRIACLKRLDSRSTPKDLKLPSTALARITGPRGILLPGRLLKND
jgi:hypothetical protein